MSLFANLNTQSDIAEEKDRLGGPNLFDSDIYKFSILHAYITQAESGAMALNLKLKTEDGRELRQTMYMTSGKEKGNKNYYEKDGQKHYLPGFNMANSLAQMATGQEIAALEDSIEEKVIPLYNKDSKAEVPTKVKMIMALVNTTVYAGVLRQKTDKQKKNEATGQYESTGETREENEIDKFFCANEKFDKMTAAEIRAKGEAVFFEKWLEKNKGEIVDKSGKGNKAAGTAGAPSKPAGSGNKPTNSLFG